jgi:hypothetical protein
MYSSTHTLTSALDGGEWSASSPGRFTPRERALGTHWIRGWVGPRAVLDTVVKRKIPSPRRESNPRTPIVQPVSQSSTDWAGGRGVVKFTCVEKGKNIITVACYSANGIFIPPCVIFSGTTYRNVNTQAEFTGRVCSCSDRFRLWEWRHFSRTATTFPEVSFSRKISADLEWIYLSFLPKLFWLLSRKWHSDVMPASSHYRHTLKPFGRTVFEPIRTYCH